MKKIKLVIWDWYATLSKNHIYKYIKQNYPNEYKQIGFHLISNRDIIENWQSGKLKFNHLHLKFSSITSLDKTIFDNCLRSISVQNYVNQELFDIIKLLRAHEVINVILSDNIEIWDEVFLPNYINNFELYFSGMYKLDNNTYMESLSVSVELKLLEIVQKYRCSSDEVLVVDDSDLYKSISMIAGYNNIKHNSQKDLVQKLRKLFHEYF